MEQSDSTRRGFLKSSLAIAAAGFGLRADAAEKAPAKKPGKRAAGGGQAPWRITCRDANLREIGELDVWAAVKAVGLDGIEVDLGRDMSCPYIYGKDKVTLATPEGVKTLADALKANKCRITAFCLHNEFDARGKEEIDWVAKVTRVAEELRVPAVRLDVWPKKIKEEEEFLKYSINVGKQLIEATPGSKVRYGVENHGPITNKPEFLRKMFAGVASPRFGLTLDTANFYWFGHPLSKLYEIYAEFASVACHTHCKSIKYPEEEREKQRKMGWEYGKYNCPIFDGDIDFKKVAAILREHKYRGDLCIENESLGRVPSEKRKEILKKEADLLRSVAKA